VTKDKVVLKGKKDGVNVILTSDMPFAIILKEIQTKFEQSREFFSKGKYKVNFSGRSLSQKERLQVEQMLLSLLDDSEILIGYDTPEELSPKPFEDIKEGYTKFHEGTVRSGQRVQSEGNLVIVGDVNPGSEIVAAGNVVVMGAMRGIVHAGCTGNRSAFIVALNLAPTQIRIADIITRPPDNEIRTDVVPEKAFVKENTIYIEEYLTKL
jgi:septum site-determining protein MinC